MHHADNGYSKREILNLDILVVRFLFISLDNFDVRGYNRLATLHRITDVALRACLKPRAAVGYV